MRNDYTQGVARSVVIGYCKHRRGLQESWSYDVVLHGLGLHIDLCSIGHISAYMSCRSRARTWYAGAKKVILSFT